VTIRRARQGVDVASVPTVAAPSRDVLVTDLVTALGGGRSAPVANVFDTPELLIVMRWLCNTVQYQPRQPAPGGQRLTGFAELRRAVLLHNGAETRVVCTPSSLGERHSGSLKEGMRCHGLEVGSRGHSGHGH
jgi:hypothetical protein